MPSLSRDILQRAMGFPSPPDEILEELRELDDALGPEGGYIWEGVINRHTQNLRDDARGYYRSGKRPKCSQCNTNYVMRKNTTICEPCHPCAMCHRNPRLRWDSICHTCSLQVIE